MNPSPSDQRSDLPPSVLDLANRLGARILPEGSGVRLAQTGRMKRALGSASWMSFTARQSMQIGACDFVWRARFPPFGLIGVCDALENGVGRLDVTALGFIPMVRTPHTPALMRGELMRYLAELPWVPDAILNNPALRWREGSTNEIIVASGEGATAAEVTLGLDDAGRVATMFAPDRPRSDVEPTLPTPWRGRFADYRLHQGRWIPFAGEVGWVLDGKEEVYWQGRLNDWATGPGPL